MNALTAKVYELRIGSAMLRFAPHLGGRITACELEGSEGQSRAVVHPYPETHTDLNAWSKGGVYPLVPYSGRLRNSQVLHDGRVWNLRPYPGSAHTLHGIAQRRSWTLLELESSRATLQYLHTPDQDWPWAFKSWMTFELQTNHLLIRISLRNTGISTMPGGIGLHPYIPHSTAECVRYRASVPWPFDKDYLALPQSDEVVCNRVTEQVLSTAEFRTGEVTRFHSVWQGPLTISDQLTEKPRLTMTGLGDLNQLLLHRPAGAPYFCIEPVSHLADGFNLAAQGQYFTGSRSLQPGEIIEGGLSIVTA